jgi:hypothetical protein
MDKSGMEGDELCIYKNILRILPEDYCSPYQIFKAGRKIIKKTLNVFPTHDQTTPWGLKWDDLTAIAEKLPGAEGRAFWRIVVDKKGGAGRQCLLCWRKFQMTFKNQSTCFLHSSDNVKEYFRLKRLLKKFEELLPRCKHQTYLIPLPELLSKYPNVDQYLRKKGMKVDNLRGNEGAWAVLSSLYAPLNEAPTSMTRFPRMELDFGDTLPRAEAWLSLLDIRTGRAKGWGGKRLGSGIKPCHPIVTQG